MAKIELDIQCDKSALKSIDELVQKLERIKSLISEIQEMNINVSIGFVKPKESSFPKKD